MTLSVLTQLDWNRGGKCFQKLPIVLLCQGNSEEVFLVFSAGLISLEALRDKVLGSNPVLLDSFLSFGQHLNVNQDTEDDIFVAGATS